MSAFARGARPRWTRTGSNDLASNLEKALNAIDQLTTSDFLQAGREVQQELYQTVQQCFATRSDPSGMPWLPLKRPPSRATGAMREGALRAIAYGQVSVDGFQPDMSHHVFHWMFQDRGTRTIPPRPYWPAGPENVENLLSKKLVELANRKTTTATPAGGQTDSTVAAKSPTSAPAPRQWQTEEDRNPFAFFGPEIISTQRLRWWPGRSQSVLGRVLSVFAWN